MIDPDFLVLTDAGLFCKVGGFYLDPQVPAALALISHAHGDHAVRSNQHIICTPATKAIMDLRYKKAAGVAFQTVNYRVPITINGIQVTFYPAGHILGSAQILLEYKGVRYLYTGDIKLQEDPTCEPAEFPKADVLITESTFADPGISHPDPAEEISKLNATSFNILLGAYSLGKSQRLIDLLNRHCPDKKIMVHHSILPINRVYETFSFPPGKYEPYNRRLMKDEQRNYVYIIPPVTFNSYFRARNVLRVFASGWKKLQAQNDLELYISDHADWNELLTLIDRVDPEQIWTLHGDGKHLKVHYEGKRIVKLLNQC